MGKVDMSAEAITARLKLVSDLRDLCLLLGTAKIESRTEKKNDQDIERSRCDPKRSK